MDFHEIWYLVALLKFIDFFQSWLRSYRNNGHFSWRSYMRLYERKWLGGKSPGNLNFHGCLGNPQPAAPLREYWVMIPSHSHTGARYRAHSNVIDLRQLRCHWHHSQRSKVKLWRRRQNCCAARTFPNLFILLLSLISSFLSRFSFVFAFSFFSFPSLSLFGRLV
jgi:hypothetical protein